MTSFRNADRDGRLERLLAIHAARLQALVDQHCGRSPGLDPADVAQEVRIRLWKALERDQSEGFPASYVQRVVATVVVDALRRSAVRAADPLPEDEAHALAAGEADRPERRAASDQALAGLDAALAALPQRRRVAVRLHLQGFVAAEIAALCRVSVDAVRKLVERGLEELREELRARGLGDLDE
jgi:RNA polymerase sigma-70 factor (ECF subfamily)